MKKMVDFPRKFWYSLLNYGGVLYTWFTILSLFFINAYFTCPALKGDQCPYYIALGLFFIFEITLNFFCFHYYARLNRVDVIFPLKSLPLATFRQDGTMEIDSRMDPKTTKFCFNCRRTVPLRSHHCPLCEYCVLKKDHHCFLTGGCVGHGNQRYFVVFLFWASVGALYGAWITGSYLNTFFQPFFPFGFIDYIFPIAVKRWLLFQHMTIVNLAYSMIFSAGLGGGLASLIFFSLQMKLILQGSTMYEMFRKDNGVVEKIELKPDRLPCSLRIQCVFGKYWFLNFLLPLPFQNRLDEDFKKLLYDSHLKEM